MRVAISSCGPSDLPDELGNFSTSAVPGQTVVELTVSCADTEGELLGGISGWTWQGAAGIDITRVHAAQPSTGLGSQLLAEFERTAANHGVRRVFVTSFTFPAPGFYERQGCREIFSLGRRPH